MELYYKYIKKKRLVWRLGMNLLLIHKGKGDKIYEEHETSDSEFYSPSPIEDLVELSIYYMRKVLKTLWVKMHT